MVLTLCLHVHRRAVGRVAGRFSALKMLGRLVAGTRAHLYRTCLRPMVRSASQRRQLLLRTGPPSSPGSAAKRNL